MALQVPTYQSNAPIQNASGGSSTPYQGAAAFSRGRDNGLAQGLDQFTRGLDKFNQAYSSIVIQDRQNRLEMDVLKDMQNYQEQSAAWQDEYTASHQGKDAGDAEAQARAFHEQTFGALRDKWANNPHAMQYIQAHGGALAQQGVNAMRDYSFKQGEVYGDKVMAGREKNAMLIMSNPLSTQQEIEAAYKDYRDKMLAWQTRKGMPLDAAMAGMEMFYRQSMGQRMQNELASLMATDPAAAAGFLRDVNSGAADDAFSFVSNSESGGDSMAIGYDAVGGTSYGAYQISSKNMPSFISWLDKNGNSAAAEELRSAGPADSGGKGGPMADAWRRLVSSGEITPDMERAFIDETHIQPAINGLPQDLTDAYASDPVVAKAVASTSVQHGADAAQRLIGNAWQASGGDVGRFVHTLQTSRKGQFGSSSEAVRQGVHARIDRETAMLSKEHEMRQYLTPVQLLAWQNHADTAVEQARKQAAAQAITQNYSAISSMAEQFASPERQYAEKMRAIGRIEDRDLRNKLGDMAKEDYDFTVQANKADVQGEIDTLTRQMPSDLTPSQKEAFITNSDFSQETKDAMLGDEGKKRSSPTYENTLALDDLYRMIGRGEIQGTDAEKMQAVAAYAKDNYLTTAQFKDAKEYLQSGGNIGGLTFASVEAEYKRLTGNRKIPAGYFDAFRSWARNNYADKPLNAENIRQIMNTFLLEGTTAGGGRFYGDKDEPFVGALVNKREGQWTADYDALPEDVKAKAQSFLSGKGFDPTPELVQGVATITAGGTWQGMSSLDDWPSAEQVREAKEATAGLGAGQTGGQEGLAVADAGTPSEAVSGPDRAMREQAAERDSQRQARLAEARSIPQSVASSAKAEADDVAHDYMMVMKKHPVHTMSGKAMDSAIRGQLEREFRRFDPHDEVQAARFDFLMEQLRDTSTQYFPPHMREYVDGYRFDHE